MRVLTDATQINHTLLRLMRSYKHYSWSVAWASRPQEHFDLLRKKKSRIQRLVVGTHFYQTHPDFLREFMGVANMKVVFSADGVFHPKVYLFSDSDKKWECVIGSANFTDSALSCNSEVAVLLSNMDSSARVLLRQIHEALETHWRSAKILTTDKLKSYVKRWKKKQENLRSLQDHYPRSVKGGKSRATPSSPLSPPEIPLMNWTWPEYYRKVTAEGRLRNENRAEVLRLARRAFLSHKNYHAMDKQTRYLIAGIFRMKDDDELDLGWFGNMQGSGRFKHVIKENHPCISKALDQIPPDGAVSEAQYGAFVTLYRKVFADTGGAGIATATRLLTMKRPDMFLCLDSKNRRKLAKAFQIPQNIDFDDYWNCIIARIRDSDWWTSSRPKAEAQRVVWKGRAAFLDAIFYERR